MRSICVECTKELEEKEGFVASTGVFACSKVCIDSYTKKIPNEGKSSLVTYSRVTGYYTPIKSWNKGKLREHMDRKRYNVRGAV